jgi:hypothetical protein
MSAPDVRRSSDLNRHARSDEFRFTPTWNEFVDPIEINRASMPRSLCTAILLKLAKASSVSPP